MKNAITAFSVFLVFLLLFSPVQPVQAQNASGPQQGGDAELAQELSNPLADLTSIPFQMNYNRDFGSEDDGWNLQTNIQPVVPFSINDDLNLITRTIVPVIYQDDTFPVQGPSSAWAISI